MVVSCSWTSTSLDEGGNELPLLGVCFQNMALMLLLGKNTTKKADTHPSCSEAPSRLAVTVRQRSAPGYHVTSAHRRRFAVQMCTISKVLANNPAGGRGT